MKSIRKTILASWARYAGTVPIAKPYNNATTGKPAKKRVHKRKKKAAAKHYKKTLLARHAMKTRKYKYKRNCGCKRNPGSESLKQWAKRTGNGVKSHKNGSMYVHSLPSQKDAVSLHHLKNYRVSSLSGGTYWLTKK